MSQSQMLLELIDKVEDFKKSNQHYLFLSARFTDFSFDQELLDYCKKENISIISDLGFRYEFSIKRKPDEFGNWIYRSQMPFNFEIEIFEEDE